MAARAHPGHDTLCPVFDPVLQAQVENTMNSHTDVLIFDRSGQYDGIAIPIDIVAWHACMQQEHASMQQQLASLEQEHASMQQEDASMQQRLASVEQDAASMQQEHASMQQGLASMEWEHASMQ